MFRVFQVLSSVHRCNVLDSKGNEFTVLSACVQLLTDLQRVAAAIERVKRTPPGERRAMWDSWVAGERLCHRPPYTGWVWMVGLDGLGEALADEEQEMQQMPPMEGLDDDDPYPF